MNKCICKYIAAVSPLVQVLTVAWQMLAFLAAELAWYQFCPLGLEPADM